MRVLLDTNIIIHRESASVINEDIGVLFRWIDNLKYEKYIHPITIEEIGKYKDPKTLRSLSIKLNNYNILKTIAPLHKDIDAISKTLDRTQNDINDTKLLNEIYCERADILITEDKKIHLKANQLNIDDKVLYIDAFLERVSKENPALTDYKVLAVKKEYIGNIDINDPFFDSFKSDYIGFSSWFNKKSDEFSYICKEKNNIMAFLYLKVENRSESYSDIFPIFSPKKRLKIGTFKVVLNGFRLGERFLKIIFDNAIKQKVDEIYVTVFNKTTEQERLIRLLVEFGFVYHGKKVTKSGEEEVYTRDFSRKVTPATPKFTFPYVSANTKVFLVPIYPDYHTDLLPDSILTTESAKDFEENEPFRNAISKVYICRSFERNLTSGDIIIFYRTGGYYKSVITTIGIVENIITDIKNEEDFVKLCRNRSIFTDKQLLEHWNYRRNSRPFIVNFLYTYSFPKRLNLKDLIDLGIIANIESAPRGFTMISKSNFIDIIRETKTDERLIID